MGKIVVDIELCKGCALCTDVCAKKILAMSDRANSKGYYPVMLTDEAKCTGCALCAQICPEVAIEVYR